MPNRAPALDARRALVVLAVTAAALVAAAVVTRGQPRVYRAHATLLVAPDESIADTGDQLRALEALDRRSTMATLARIPGSEAVRAGVGSRLGAGDLALYRVAGSVVPNTTVLRVEVEGPDPDVAARLANAAADLTQAEVRKVYRIYVLRPLDHAEPDRRPVQPDPWRNMAVAGVLGLGAGIALAVTLDRGRRLALAA